jgi:hypothetical protein
MWMCSRKMAMHRCRCGGLENSIHEESSFLSNGQDCVLRDAGWAMPKEIPRLH